MNTMSQPIRIKVIEVIGSDICVSSEDGAKIFEKLNVAIETDRPVELDFSGVQIVISAFLNAAIGRLVEKNSKESIRGKVTFTNIAHEDEELIDRVLENAESFYADPDKYRRALEIDDPNDEE
jgi:hypothetical protein